MNRVLLRLWLVSIFVLPLTACGATSLQTAEPDQVGLSAKKLAKIRARLAGLVEQKRIAGGAALVARNGQVAFHEAVGYQDVDTRTPMAKDTIFRICSMTKPITSVGVMMLHEQKKLALSDPVSKYIPEFKATKVAVKKGGGFSQVAAERPITIHHLLTHTSGLTYGFFNREYFGDAYAKAGISDGLAETEGSIGENCRKLAGVPLTHQPGSAWGYGLSADVLGRVIEVASGTTVEEFFHSRIFEPLEMKDTCFRLPKAKHDRLATIYRPVGPEKKVEKLPKGGVKDGARAYDATYSTAGKPYFSGGAGLVSTVTDYARFCQMLLNGGELGGERLLKPETVALMTKHQIGDLRPAFRSHGDRFGYGFGIVSEEAKDEGLGSPGTFSWGGFYFTYFWVDPQEKLIGVVMCQLQPWGGLSLWKDFRTLTYQALIK